MKKLFFAACAAVLLHAGAASAGAMEPANFAGGYVGGHGGYAWGEREGCGSLFDFCGFGLGEEEFEYNQDGWLVGAQVGYNHMFSDSFLFGLEATGSFASIEGTLDLDLLGGLGGGNGEYNTLGTFTARLGWVMDNILIFGKGGLAVASFDYDGMLGCQFDQTRSGYLFGGGGEFKVSEMASVGIEYNYINFGEDEQTCASFGFLPTFHETDAELHVIKFLFNIQLGSL